MVHSKRIFLRIAGFLAALLLGTTGASAQFSLDTSQDATSPAPLTVDKRFFPIDVVNDAQARADRKVNWRLHNTVDTKVSLTGTLNEYNQAWRSNNQNSLSVEVSAYYYHTYTTGRHTSIFKFDGLFGINYLYDFVFKTQDMFKIYYMANWKIRKEGFWKDWAYGASTDFTSQFAEGYKSRTEPTVPWSNFMAPGTLNLGAGVTYTSPNPKLPFIATINPVSINALFVMDDRLSDARRKALGIPGNPFRTQNDNAPRTTEGNLPINYKLEGGSSLNVAFNRTFTFGKRQGVTLQYNTTLSSFYGWMTQVSRRDYQLQLPEIMPTVLWNNSLSFSPVKFLLIEFRHVLKYDKSQIDKVQMQYYLRIGLTYRYLNKK